MKRAYAAAVMVASGLLAPAAQAQATPNDTAQDNQKDSGSTAHRVPPFDPGYWTPERMRNAKPAPMPTDTSDISQQADPIRINKDGDIVRNDSVTHTVPPFDPGYWTPERMRDAEPAPMPSFPEGQEPVKISDSADKVTDDSVAHTVAPDEQDPNYWTPERMRNAQPVENGVGYNYKILKEFFKTIRG
jgi:putative DELLA protein DWARF8